MMRGLLVASMLVALAACQPAPQASKSAAAVVVAPAVSLHAVRDGLYTAGQPSGSDWSTISARGVRTVINLRPAEEMAGRDEAAEVAAAGMRYVTIPVANAEAITPEAARQLEGVLREAQGPVLLHCASGNRAGGLLAVTAAQQEGMPADQAVQLGRRAGMKSTETRVRHVLGLPADPSAKEPAPK
ncbi:MAG: protein tyrosine phosphatase family protein [Proteobacteria bacterium]|nr:protein tyrosine phosphatase family protein [Pseudomonadota bacterium]